MWQLTITWPDDAKTVDVYDDEFFVRSLAAEAISKVTERCDGYKAQAVAVELREC